MRPLLTALLCLIPASALAQIGDVGLTDLGKKVLEKKPPEVAAALAEGAKAEPVDPWTFGLNVGLSGAVSDSRDVVGQIDGNTKNAGLVLDGSAVWRSGQHEIENLLKVQHSQTSAPPTDIFVKSTDQIDLSTTYLYYLKTIHWMGPYTRAKLSTNLLTSNLVFGEEIDVQRGDDPVQTVPSATKIRVNGPFEPFRLTQSVGWFAKPIRSKPITLETKLGLAAQEIFVRDGYVAAGAPAKPEGAPRKVLVLAPLAGSVIPGAELEVAAAGAVTENLSYGVRVNTFQPFAGADDDKDGLQTDLEAKLSVKLSKWASLDYVLKAKKIPLIQGNDGKFQLSNAFMVTAGFNVL